MRTMIYVHTTDFEMACLDRLVLVMGGSVIENIDIGLPAAPNTV